MQTTVHSRTLRRAAALLGGVPALAKYLGISLQHLQPWMSGAVPPPDDVFLKAVDVVAEHDMRLLRGELQVSAE